MENPDKRQMPRRSRTVDRKLALPMKTLSPPAKATKSARQPIQKLKRGAIGISSGEASKDLKDLLINQLVKEGKVKLKEKRKK